MQTTQRLRNILRTIVQTYGNDAARRYLWNAEFAGGKWECLTTTAGDCVYPYIEKYARNGRILDLGCGSGNTANELTVACYRDYTGVDISDVALETARQRSEAGGRLGKCRYVRSDISTYQPTGQYDVILFRDSIYYVAWARIPALLARYAHHLRDDGVFIVRMWNGTGKYRPIAQAIEDGFDVVDRYDSDAAQAIVLVFRPKSPSAGLV